MAGTRPLKLRSEVAVRRAEKSSSQRPIAQVWVDSGVFHLDGSFDYLIPDDLSAVVDVGIRVQVPFNGREVEAIILSRSAESVQGGLKPISKVVSPVSVATTRSLALIAQVAARWSAHPYDILRSAIPPRVASVDKFSWLDGPSSNFKKQKVRGYIQLPPYQPQIKAVVEHINSLNATGSVLILAPDSRTVSELLIAFPQALVLDSDLPRQERYRNFLSTRYGSKLIVIGTRSAVFAPITDLETIVVLDEGSEHHYEIRTPGWNVRDVAMTRSIEEECSLVFMGYCPSSEVARLIELKWLTYSCQSHKVLVQSFDKSSGELIPSRLISKIRAALKQGPILFIAPTKGYAQAITCSKCRNIARCECGGKLIQKSATAAISCVTCSREYAQWACAWCKSQTPFLLRRGSDRFAFEIGAAFPGEQISQSSGDLISAEYKGQRGIVIATFGAIPIYQPGYSLIVILEAQQFFSQSDLRAQERAREMAFHVASFAHKDALIALVIATDHPIIGALSAWKPALLSQRELRERSEVGLPPYSRAVTLDITTSEAAQLLRGLEQARDDGRLPPTVKFLGPSELRSSLSRIVSLVPIEDGQILISLLHEFQRRRSASKKVLSSIRVDPYSLSR